MRCDAPGDHGVAYGEGSPARLADLLDRDDVRSGGPLVLLSAGAGVTWSAATVEVF
ncbi:hypothetical protein [Streptomyces alanosinicus]|uniref:Beta-ketoacyl-[acyl-carrier-protein] synthase III C-terminal domain-containing protein n=1 Tax=Streptomyces alanosinicus TaxID=68171 RepID=A0A918YRR5_9ACTN|nr:hypothetical protein [Streptomyces alanosinicus]GHE12676.1 hypothetical protein GCM10010339_77040 [Streptomyces alanosinicus]